MFGFNFLRGQGVVRLTIRVLGLFKTILLKTFVDRSYEKILNNKKGYFYRGMILSPPYGNFILEI